MNKKVFFGILILLLIMVIGVLVWQLWPKDLGWKTYTNDQYGFEIQYPSNWRYSEEKKPLSVKFIPKGQDMGYEGETGWFPIELGINQIEPDTQSYLDKGSTMTQEKILINGVSVLKLSDAYSFTAFFTEPDDNGYYCAISERKIGFLWDISDAEDEDPVKDYGRSEDAPSQIFNQMLSTFKFINQ